MSDYYHESADTYEDDPRDDFCAMCGHDLHGGDCFPPEHLDPLQPPPPLGLRGYEWRWISDHPIPHWEFYFAGVGCTQRETAG